MRCRAAVRLCIVLRLCRERVAHHQRRAGRGDRDPGRGERGSGRLLRADGRPWKDPRSRRGSVLQDRAGGEGQVPLVGHDDAHLHAGQATPVRHAVHRHRRQVGEVGPRKDARPAVSVDVLHADDPPAQHRLVPEEERRDRHRPPVQSARRSAGPPPAPPAPHRRARHHSSRTAERRAGLRGEEGKGTRGRAIGRAGRALVSRHRLGQEAIPPRQRSGRARD